MKKTVRTVEITVEKTEKMALHKKSLKSAGREMDEGSLTDTAALYLTCSKSSNSPLNSDSSNESADKDKESL